MNRALRLLCSVVASAAACMAAAAEPAWLPVRDQNPFVLAAGFPLPPAPPAQAGEWQLDAGAAEGNSQLLGSRANAAIVYAAETRESRLTFAYAFDAAWSARVSLGAFWIGGGFLDAPIRHFHALIGAPRGYRDRLGVTPPYVRVERDGHTLFLLDRAQQGTAPLLAEVTRSWTPSDDARAGVSLAAALPLGDARGLQDLGAASLALSAFGDWRVGDALQTGVRVGYLRMNGNDVLPALARHGVPFADAYARVPLPAGWQATLQYDAHGTLYRAAPAFLGDAGVLTVGLGHALGARSDLQLTLGEDVPIRHTQDVVLGMALRIRSE